MGNSACGGNLGDCCIPAQKQNEGDFLRVVKFPEGGNGSSSNGLMCCMESKPQSTSRECAYTRHAPEANFIIFDDTGGYETPALTYEPHRERLGNCSAPAPEQNPAPPSACNPQALHHTADVPALHYTAARAMPHGSNPAWPVPAAASGAKPKEPLVSRRPRAPSSRPRARLASGGGGGPPPLVRCRPHTSRNRPRPAATSAVTCHDLP